MRDKSIIGASIWMIVISILLFWLPGIGPLIAGYVGGRAAGDVKHALMAALLPMVAAGGVVFLLLTFVGLPFVGVIAGAALVAYIVIVLEIALVAGAVVGGILASSK